MRVHNTALECIIRGKARNRKYESWAIIHHGDGKHYSFFYYRTRIAIGRIGEMPFLFNMGGWNTMTTKRWLADLGACISTRKITMSRERNPETGRMKSNRIPVLHINGCPMWIIDSNGEHQLRYDSWYFANGSIVPDELNAQLNSEIWMFRP